jgi:homocysteine S-methyltransferase
MAKRTQDFGMPIFTGVWSLLSGRQADFLDAEVRGIVVQEQVRIHMAGSEGDEGRARGLALARGISRAALERFPGVYSTTVELAAFARRL